ncbi:regulatory protein [Sinorhizobium fredii USDA 205]|uniref:Transcriptional regulator n=1 Tax=Rhizobium fredii TaxID=380 RepID=A0A844ADS7_RHIFR|nr:winged helix-turn-helix domain-containing protein [Sinorhizobium fredii]ASY71841.1 Adenylate cyclase [Sinorhizobium fredii CCBAU 83666]KSV81998.1 regulatory protein [Sinorhizobium fredii USDA 205]MQX09620.1 transcriptional regulator [Sinorhizobium fredii]GEC35377.1 transcriptional regulator [Sinorhizobium fredii]GLS08518.1 transcriptional regulator [Sinorhizobium fredii]
MVEPVHAFGDFLLEPGSGLLRRNGKSVAVGQRGLALLEALLEAKGGVVSKTDLMERAWPDTIVEESNLTVQIAALRKALGVAPGGRDWITTIPRIGYRLVRAGAGAGEADIVFPARPTLAVLPFANVSGDPDQDYFADGAVNDVITALSRFKSFAVVSGHSCGYKGRFPDVRLVAKELGVRYVLEGSIRRSGNRLRIATQLVDGGSGTHLWAETFDGEIDDIFDFQDRITVGVATLVEPHVQTAEIDRSRRERPGSIAAYDIYLQALAKVSTESERDNAEAYALLIKALEAEPDNALLLSHAAWALEHRHTMGWPSLGPDDVRECAALARRGLEHAAGDAMVMAHCGVALLQTAKDYDWAVAVLQSAAEANPNNLMVVVRAGLGHLHCGSLEEALAHFHRANRLSPGDRGAHFSLCGIADVHVIRGDYAEAIAWAARALASNPNFDPTLWVLIAANAHLGRTEEAHRYLRELKKLAPAATIARIKAGQPAKDPDRIATLLQGLRKAGLEEG